MKTVLKTTEVVDQQMAIANMWVNGQQREVYFAGPRLHGSKAKYFIRQPQFKVVRGRVYQDEQLKPYFVEK